MNQAYKRFIRVSAIMTNKTMDWRQVEQLAIFCSNFICQAVPLGQITHKEVLTQVRNPND